jgi:hypothetical protein
MFSQLSNCDKKNISQYTHTTLSAEQFEQIVTAILEGKYSWACVLMLRFGGHNPIHYLPYRTYKRLVRDNRLKQSDRQQTIRGNNAFN